MVDIDAIVNSIDAQDAFELGVDDVSEFFLTGDDDVEVMEMMPKAIAAKRSQSATPRVDQVLSGRRSGGDEFSSYGAYNFEDR